jgi:hypothetical protein
MVEVDQGERAHPGAGQRLGRPGADAADTDHDDMGGVGSRASPAPP